MPLKISSCDPSSNQDHRGGGGGGFERSAETENVYFSFTVGLLDDAKGTQDCKTEETRRIYI